MAELRPLEEGSLVYSHGPHRERQAVRRIPPGLSNTFYLSGDLNDTGLSTSREYIVGSCNKNLFCRSGLGRGGGAHEAFGPNPEPHHGA